jgi:hypothetical protein
LARFLYFLSPQSLQLFLHHSYWKQPFTRNWDTVNELQHSEKENKRDELQELQNRFAKVCRGLPKRFEKEECPMPSAMPWSNWLTQNEKIVVVRNPLLFSL